MGSKAQQQRPHTAFSNSDHELRLQELWKLSQRQQETDPVPGHYMAVPASAFTRRSPHRPTQQPLDGPFPLQPGQVSTRVHNLDRFLLLRDSGLGPAAYDQGSSKDALARRAATAKIGTSRRVTSAVGPNQVCLSLSRSLAAGLDWRHQLTHAEIQQHLTATAAAVAAGWAASPRTLAAGATCSASGCRVGAAKPGDPAAATAAGVLTKHADSAGPAGGEQQQPEQHEKPIGSSASAGTGAQQQIAAEGQQCLQEEQVGPAAPPDSALHQQQQFVPGGSSWPQPPDITSCRARSARSMPWQLAASIQHHEQLIEAMQAQVALQQQGQQQQQQQHHPPVQQEQAPEQAHEEQQEQLQGSHLSRFCSQEQAQRQHEQQRQPNRQQRLASAPAARPVVVVMQQQEVVQHQSAARAATAVQQLAVRRQQWEQLSGLRPPPYPVFLPDAPPGTKL